LKIQWQSLIIIKNWSYQSKERTRKNTSTKTENSIENHNKIYINDKNQLILINSLTKTTTVTFAKKAAGRDSNTLPDERRDSRRD
jgi:hypothetical protein